MSFHVPISDLTVGKEEPQTCGFAEINGIVLYMLCVTYT